MTAHEGRTTASARRTDSAPEPQLGAIVLAAGMARRMGGNKLLAAIGGKTVIGRVLEQLRGANLAAVVVVLPPGDDLLWAEVKQYVSPGFRLRMVANPVREQGMSSSLQLGIRALPSNVAGVFVVLGDQPFLPLRFFETMARAFRTGDALVVAPVYDGVRGHPVLFHRQLFPELLAVQGDQGGRTVLERHRDRTRLVPFDCPLARWDIDTPEDLEALKRLYDFRRSRP